MPVPPAGCPGKGGGGGGGGGGPPDSQPAGQKPTPRPLPPIEFRDRAGKDRGCDDELCKNHCAKPRDESVGASVICGKDGVPCGCACPDELKKRRGTDEGHIGDDDVFDAYVKCSVAHENQHIDDLDALDPPVCEGKQPGDEIPTTPQRECRAYERELMCIGNNVPKDCLKDTSCRKAFRQLLADRYTGCQKQCKDEAKCKRMAKEAVKRLMERSAEK